MGRYHDIMSHENFEQQEFETVNNDQLNGTVQEVTDLYHLDDSYDSSVVP